jgi:hypothetical protein
VPHNASLQANGTGAWLGRGRDGSGGKFPVAMVAEQNIAPRKRRVTPTATTATRQWSCPMWTGPLRSGLSLWRAGLASTQQGQTRGQRCGNASAGKDNSHRVSNSVVGRMLSGDWASRAVPCTAACYSSARRATAIACRVPWMVARSTAGRNTSASHDEIVVEAFAEHPTNAATWLNQERTGTT